MFLQRGVLLNEAEISVKRPLLDQKSDRVVINVSNSAEAAGDKAIITPQKVSGIVIIQERVTLGLCQKSKFG